MADTILEGLGVVAIVIVAVVAGLLWIASRMKPGDVP